MKFKTGDRVVIVESGMAYTTYSNMAEEMKLPNWRSGRRVNTNVEGIIVGEGIHEHTRARIYGIQTEKGDFIIGERGFTKLDGEMNVDDRGNLI